MEVLVQQFIQPLPVWGLFIVLAVSLVVLGKGADLLVDEAIALSERFRIPPVVIGATIVSLGTTLPEMSVSVLAAVQGEPDIALGNAVGSIICDTGLILGIGALIRPLPLDARIVNRQGWIQIGSALLLVVLCLPFSNLSQTFTKGGGLPQWAGFLFVGLLVLYIVWSIKHSREVSEYEVVHGHGDQQRNPLIIFLKLALGIGLVVAASKVTIPAGETIALRMGVPAEVVAASLIALGTSLPELVTVITSVIKGRGDLAVGNVIGADILNVLFVSGFAAAATPAGLVASPVFFTKFFPFMVGILIVFRIAVFVGKTRLGRGWGALLLALYAVFVWLNFQGASIKH